MIKRGTELFPNFEKSLIEFGRIAQVAQTLFGAMDIDLGLGIFGGSDVGYPNADLAEEKDHYVLTMEVPGVPKERLSISMNDNELKVSGEKAELKHSRQLAERQYGAFSRTIRLPMGTTAQHISSQLMDGVLTITIQKIAPDKAQSIAIK